MQYHRTKKDGSLVTVLQVYVHPNNKAWAEEAARKLGLKVSPYIDQLLTYIRKNGLPEGFKPLDKKAVKDESAKPLESNA